MSTPSKVSLVFIHGVWADGSRFAKLIPTLPAEGQLFARRGATRK